MREIEIGTFAKLHELIENYDERTLIYRGMKSRNLPLIPKIGRIIPPESAKSREWNEKEILRLFKEQALPYLDFMPDNDWDWLTLGQQYGLPTRLLDWTANPLVACYFAVEEQSGDDSVIYVYRNKSYIDSKNIRIRSNTIGSESSSRDTFPDGSLRKAVYSRSTRILMSLSNQPIWRRSSFRITYALR